MSVEGTLTKALDQMTEQELKMIMAEIVLVVDYPYYTKEQKYNKIEKIYNKKIYNKCIE